MCELDSGRRPLAGHPIYLLGKQCEGVRAMPGAAPEMPGSDGRGYKLKMLL